MSVRYFDLGDLIENIRYLLGSESAKLITIRDEDDYYTLDWEKRSKR